MRDRLSLRSLTSSFALRTVVPATVSFANSPERRLARKPCLAMYATLAALGVSLLQGGTPTQSTEVALAVPPLQRSLSTTIPGQADFVRAPDTTLYFSPHLLPALTDTSDAAAQLSGILDELSHRLQSVASDERQLIRLTLTLVDESDHARAAEVLAQRFRDHAPAVTWQSSPLPHASARVAVEAIAASRQRPDRKIRDPAGSSVALTMASLLRSAAELGAAPSGVAQIRVFLQPFSGRQDALDQIVPLFPAGKCPPIIVTEWTLPLPVEIEMIVARDRSATKLESPLTFPVLAGKPRSPRFSHAAIVEAGVPLLFLGDIDAGPNVPPTEEWPAIFARLGPLLGRAGSSFRLLVKATYLLEEGSPRNSLNDTRAVYYDPLRPPAASAVGVRSVGIPGRASALEMIAVPRDAVSVAP